ncbi:MAG: tetratricopeptide repeat protein [Candidatus Latescibacteria bacterium]|nr:tetratricopeptide repeat protein [Candidatus Latescibacterota bacterium]
MKKVERQKTKGKCEGRTILGWQGWGFCRLPFAVCLLVLVGCGQYTAYDHLDQALLAQAQGDIETALVQMQAAVEIQPQDAYLLRQLGWMYQQRKEYDAAFVAFQTALKLEPAYVAVYQDLAMLSEEQGDIEGVIGWLESVVAAVPDYKASYRDLATFYLRQERFQDARSLLDGVVVRWPEATWAYFRLGGLYVHLDLPAQAIESFRKVVVLEPVTDIEYALFVEAHSALGNVYYDQKNYDLAIEFFGKAIELNPADHSSMNNLAWVYATQRTLVEDGIHFSRRSLQLRPNSPTYLDTLAELYFISGDVEQAIQIIRQAIAQDPDQPELRAHLRRQLARFLARGQGRV